MKITVVGCGNAFSHHNYNQSFLLEEMDPVTRKVERLLIDCGSRIPNALWEQEIDVKTIGYFYVSHAHGDHCGGIEEVAFSLYDWVNHPRHYSERRDPPVLIANKVLMQELWNNSFKGGLDSMEGFDSTLETFFKTWAIEPNQPFLWCGWRFQLVQQVHIMTGSVIKNTFGLFVSHATEEGRKKVFVTTDCQYFQPKQVRVFYEQADIVLQDAEFAGVDTVERQYKFGSGVHANVAELFGWPSANAMVMSPEVKRKLWLTHYQDFVCRYVPKREARFIDSIRAAVAGCTDAIVADNVRDLCDAYLRFESKDGFGNPCDWDALAKAEGLAGILKVGQEFEI
jgi:ribonuclease BN (tRNA processing enzyme)